jgi:hypothetical protein
LGGKLQVLEAPGGGNGVTVQTGSKSCEKVCCKLAFVAQHAKNAPVTRFLACISAFSQDLVSG